MVFNAAFGTNTNKSDHFEVILFSRAEHLPGVLNQKTWIDTPYNTEEKHGLWTQIDLGSNFCSATHYPWNSDELFNFSEFISLFPERCSKSCPGSLPPPQRIVGHELGH